MNLLKTSLAVVLVSWVSGPALAAKSIKVVATLPNLASLAEEVGGEYVKVSAIAPPYQDAHFVDPKPSFLTRLRSADLLLLNGLDLEIGWVPPLTLGSRNGRIVRGGEGYIDCSLHISPIEIPLTTSRAQGDVHPYGNPHYLTDPLNAELVARQLAETFQRELPSQAAYFQKRAAEFVGRLYRALFGPDLVDLVGGARLARLARTGQFEAYMRDTRLDGQPLAAHLGGWIGRLRPYAGTVVITYHKDYSYFSLRFGLKVVDYVEPKPGLPPTAKHLAELIDRLKQGDVKLLIRRPFNEHRSTDRLKETTHVPVITLPLETGGAKGVETYLDLYDYVTSRIASTLESGQGE
ncbi:MAG: metal ABC transporter substrate-binding protein [Acidobacteriota bacterium]